MDTLNPPSAFAADRSLTPIKPESSVSAVSWAAVLGGALVSAAIALILLALGAGMGLSSVSPWSGAGVSAETIGYATIIWLVLMQIISSSLGGYLAGRLRTKWTDVHSHEVYFRDTAHGFMSWALALVLSAALLGTAATSLVGAAGDLAGAGAAATALAGGAAAAGATSSARGQENGAMSSSYFIDSLFRKAPQDAGQMPNAAPAPAVSTSAAPAANSTTAIGASAAMQTPGISTADVNSGNATRNAGASNATKMEASRILVKALADGQMAPADRTYLAQLVATNTGISQADADRRVNDMITQAQAAKTKAQEKIDEARHAAAALAFWTFFALMVGAFSASFSATVGGRHREQARLP